MSDEVFQQLVDAHYAGLHRFALSLTGSDSDASDLTQQTFFIWATKGHTLRDRAKAKTWLFTTLYREFIRVQRRRHRVTFLEDVPSGAQDPPDIDVDRVAEMDNRVVVQALQDIDEIFRVPLTLFYLKDLTYHDIATILEVPIGTVMSRLSRGKSHLRAALLQRMQGGKVVEFPNFKSR